MRPAQITHDKISQTPHATTPIRTVGRLLTSQITSTRPLLPRSAEAICEAIKSGRAIAVSTDGLKAPVTMNQKPIHKRRRRLRLTADDSHKVAPTSTMPSTTVANQCVATLCPMFGPGLRWLRDAALHHRPSQSCIEVLATLPIRFRGLVFVSAAGYASPYSPLPSTKGAKHPTCKFIHHARLPYCKNVPVHRRRPRVTTPRNSGCSFFYRHDYYYNSSARRGHLPPVATPLDRTARLLPISRPASVPALWAYPSTP